MKYPTQAELRQRLTYDLDTGVFTWPPQPEFLPRWNTRYAGKPAGTIGFYGYNVISLFGEKLRANRLAWIYVHGSVPDDLLVDHKNRIRNDDRWENLRLVTTATNLANSRSRTDRAKGVYVRGSKFFSCISMAGKQQYLGTFATQAEAREAYMAAHDIIYGIEQ